MSNSLLQYSTCTHWARAGVAWCRAILQRAITWPEFQPILHCPWPQSLHRKSHHAAPWHGAATCCTIFCYTHFAIPILLHHHSIGYFPHSLGQFPHSHGKYPHAMENSHIPWKISHIPWKISPFFSSAAWLPCVAGQSNLHLHQRCREGG